jgi:hypothetical protein
MKHAPPIVMASLLFASCTGALDGGSRGDPGADPSGAAGAPTGAAGVTVVVGGAAGAAGADPGAAGVGAAGASPGAAGGGGAGSGAAGSPAMGAAGAPACGPGAIPSDVAAVISKTCIACHGSPPIQSVPSSLATYASLTAPSKTDPTKSVAAVALARLQPGAAMPMPPPPLPAASASDVAAFQSWVSAGTPPAACPDGGAGDAGGGIADPYATPVVCTSKTMWTRGNNGSMRPGEACNACHSLGEGPLFALGGTVYPTAHEPDDCNGGTVATMARVVITGADGQMITLTPNGAGNFSYQGALAKPYSAKLTYMGRERAMIATQSSGDCNGCHTEAGAMMAPGRIMLP